MEDDDEDEDLEDGDSLINQMIEPTEPSSGNVPDEMDYQDIGESGDLVAIQEGEESKRNISSSRQDMEREMRDFVDHPSQSIGITNGSETQDQIEQGYADEYEEGEQEYEESSKDEPDLSLL